MAAISTIKNLGPVMETEFNAAGVATAEDLRDMGADAGYAKLLENGISLISLDITFWS